ncbi:MAG: ABC transporter substrate-binding protein [candidate division WOR-3 bacterium]|nr:ABC transporter substrate-binding protein [candidate division WOR-3 bacterium]
MSKVTKRQGFGIVFLAFAIMLAASVLAFAASEKISYNSYMSGGVWEAKDNQIVQLFTENNPDIQVEHSVVTHEDFKNLLRVWLVSSAPPDVLTWFGGERLRYFAEKGLIADIGGIWTEYGLDQVFSEGIKDACKDQGNYYFIPLSEDVWAVFYRTDIFEELGLTPPQTWDQFVEVCAAIDEAGYVPLSIGTRYNWTAAAWFDYLDLRINGPEFHLRLMSGEARYDSPEVRKVFEYWKQILPYFLSNHTSYSGDQSTDFVIRGKAAMILQGNWITESYPAERLETELGFFPFPTIDPDVPLSEEVPIDGYLMASNALNREPAGRFLAFLASREAQQIVADYDVVARPDVTYPDTPSGRFTRRLVEEVVEPAEYVTQFYDRDTTPPMAETGMNYFVKFMVYPDQLDDILEDLEKARQENFGE